MIEAVLPFFSPEKIADSGQAFRIHMLDSTHAETVAFGRYLQIADMGDSRYAFSCTADEFAGIWSAYFDLNRDYEKVVSSIDRNDNYLLSAAEFGIGIRMLRQEVFETAISYIISQRRSIPSITTAVERICSLCGEKIVPYAPEPVFTAPSQNEFYAFPTPVRLAELSIEDLTATGVGYRAPYIARAASDFSSGKLIPDELAELPDSDLYRILMSMYGVGMKVANCIMLFAFARTSRFPVDVWIARIVDTYYGGNFDASRYPDSAGIMQQFMFYYERKRIS